MLPRRRLQKPSYASIVAPSTFENASHSLNNVIVCANENNFTSEEVRQIIRTELNPRKIQVGVKKMRTINNNRVLVQCVSKEDKDRFLTAIKEKANTLKVSSPKKRNPNVLLKNLPNEISDHDVLQLLKDQKSGIGRESTVLGGETKFVSLLKI
ncbi:uncharacterized protein TNCV_4174261 [Trichonephila clavipes]|nr:uncharacterized protein TNCV_4174261 [Trichonephila clavipes]